MAFKVMPRRGSVPPTTEQVDAETLARFVAAVESRHSDGPLLIGLDGRSGAGKSTLAIAVTERLSSVAVIKGDEFYAGGSQTEWDNRSAIEKATTAIDWRRQLAVLNRLRQGEVAEWHCYDWEAFDGSLVEEVTTTRPAEVVILEGAYSCRPELAEHLDLTVLLQIDAASRRQRLLDRDGRDHRDDWLRRWTEAEDLYFAEICPPEVFDVVLTQPRAAGSSTSARLPTC